MATPATKPVTRETSAYVRQKGLRPLIVTVHLGVIELRPKGLRQAETLDLGGLWQAAVKARVARERAEKRASRKARR